MRCDGFKLPHKYAVSAEYQWLRVCERFGAAPFDPLRPSPEQVSVLLAYERIRQAEEARLQALLAGVKAGMGVR